MSTITKISDELWDKMSEILPDEKPKNTTGRHAIPFRKVLNGIVYVLRTEYEWEMPSSKFGWIYMP